MEARVDELVPYGYVDIQISTFHAFGDRILRENALELGLPNDFKVLTRPQQAIFLKDHLFELDLDYFRPLANPTKHVEALLTFFSRLKDEDITPKEFLAFAKKKLRKAASKEDKEEAAKFLELAQAFLKYEEIKLQEGVLDFGDQIVKTLELFRSKPAILRRYQKKFKYILVDEFQDTNYAQNELLKLLAPPKSNITVVADDDQSIYKFRGAAVSNVLEFTKYWKKAKKITLTKNYRSTQPILNAAYRLISHNNPDRLEIKEKIDKRLISCVGDGPLPKHLHCQNGSVEADKVAEIIDQKVKAGEYCFKDFAILVRANDSANAFIQALNYKGIPSKFSGSFGLYKREEIRWLISFFRVLTNPTDSLSLYHLATSDIYGVKTVDLLPLFHQASYKNYHLWEVFENIEEYRDKVPDLVKKKIKKIIEDLRALNNLSSKYSAGQILYKFLERTGYLRKLTQAATLEAEAKIANIARLFDRINAFEHSSSDISALKFTQDLETLISAGEDPSQAEIDPDLDAVNILTIHSAKGLEFEVVFLVNLVNFKFPVRKMPEAIPVPEELIKETLPSGDWHLQEERRLFYVGMTRAKKELYLTSAEDYGDKRPRKVSQFVLEALDIPKIESEKIKPEPLQIIAKFNKPETIQLPPTFYSGGILKLSPYQIDDYLSCPKKFYYIHVLKIPILEYHPVIYGSAIHKAIEEYFKSKTEGKKFSQQELIEAFQQAWRSEGFITRAHEERRFEAGKKALLDFYQKQEKEKKFPVEVEKKFLVNLPELDLKISGRFDALYQEKNFVEIRDFKTSEVREKDQADKRAKESNQLSLYALAYFNLEGRLPDKLSLYFVENGLLGESQRSLEDLEKLEEKIKQVVEGIKENNFAADPDYRQCELCAYTNICPYTQKI